MHTRVLAVGFLASSGWGRWAQLWVMAKMRFHEMRSAARTRRLLARMDSRMLRDIGINAMDAQVEASRWPWDLGPPQR